GVGALVVAGSGLVKHQAEEEGLDHIFLEAGFEWREPGCSNCMSMNNDRAMNGERIASTSNRNFEGRQGKNAKTHLMGPAMAAAAALTGRLPAVRQLGWPEPRTRYPHPPRPAAWVGEVRRLRAQRGPTMEKFTQLTGVAAPLPIINLDTDKIFPAIYLKTIKRTGLSKWLFEEIRYRPDGSENPDFVLNQTPYRNAKILIGADNFGCGSSREHAPWALLDFGIRCVIAPSFADIFYNNCFKNGILPIALPKETVDELMDDARKGANAVMTIDLETQTITRPDGQMVRFDLDPF